MPNLSITRRCRRRCDYCFAQHELARTSVVDMSPEVYEEALAFLERTGFPEARLLGGEPTEHPQFSEYADKAIGRGFSVVVFSGGLIPQPALEYMADLPATSVSVVLNVAEPGRDTEALVNRQHEVCRALGVKVILGVNIRSQQQKPDYLFDWINEYGLCRNIRVGIAQPSWGGTNEFFRLRGPRVIPLFEHLVLMGDKRDVCVGFDCGFTPCMFSGEFIESHAEMFLHSRADHGVRRAADPGAILLGNSHSHERHAPQHDAVGMRCHPVVDILPEGDCIACYALSRFRRLPLASGDSGNDPALTFDRELLSILPAGIHRECVDCEFRARGMCCGGCRARRALRLRPDLWANLHHGLEGVVPRT